ADAIDPSLNPKEMDPPPTDGENIEALTSTADLLSKVAKNDHGSGANAARRLSGLLWRLAKADPATRKKVEIAIVEPLSQSLGLLRQDSSRSGLAWKASLERSLEIG